MSSVGSFGTFTTARLAIYVSQKGLSVTGNNIANINTDGYTRQRLDQFSFKTGAADRYQSASDMRVGNGALAKSVSQLRDPYLDIRFRTESASVGYHDGRMSVLDQIRAILDETNKGEKDGDGLLYAELQKYADALRHLQTEAGDEVNDTLVANSAKTLTELFHSAARRLEELRQNTETQLRQEMDDINGLLINIRNLNESIQEAEIYGDGALELRDERNNYIDELSEKLKISATYSMVDIGGKEVEKLTIRLDNANPDKDVKSDSSILVDGNYCAQLTTPLDNVDADGNSLYNPAYELFDEKSAAYEQAVKDLKSGKEVANPDGGNAFTTKAELDAYIKTFMEQATPTNKMLPYRYLDENGEGTNDPRRANQVFDDYYNITISELRDKNDKLWVDKPQVRDTYVKDDTKFPQKAVLTGNFQITGGEWKDGDTINIKVGTSDYNITVGTDLSATAANDDPKNVSNAIRQALLKDTNLAANYDITTQTTKVKQNDGTYTFNVDLTVKAKVPEAKADQPQITIGTATGGAAPTAGSFTIGTPTAVANSNPPQYTAKVTTGNKFNKGDKITVGTAPNDFTLEVGKDISVNNANSAEGLAAKLAGRLGDANFRVTAKGDTLTFTAVNAQVTGQPTRPTINFTAATPANLGPMTITGWNPGKANNNVDLMPPAKQVDNGDNTTSKVVTRYYLDDNDRWHEVVKTTTSSQIKTLDDNDLYGKLQAVREMLTEEGEFSSQADIDFDENAAIKRGIPYYQHALDLLARQFATTMNEANNGFAVDEKGNYLTKDGEVLTIGTDPANQTEGLTDAQKAIVEADALSNYIKTNFAGFVKDADGNVTNVLADKFGNPLTLGKTQLTTDNISVNGQSLKDLDFAGVNADGNMVDSNGAVIDTDLTDPANPVKLPVNFTAGTFPDQAAEDAATADLNEQALDSYLSVNNGWKLGGDLFSNRGDTDDSSGITAANISVSQSWSKGDIHVVPTYVKLFGGDTTNTTQNLNALHMGNLVDRDLVYNPQDLLEDALSDHMFEGSFNEMFVKMSTTLGNDQSSTITSLQTHYGQALDIDTSRDSVSAVDLNDEAMDLMQYTHSLTAAYRLMTTIDDMLERLITGTGVTR